MTEVHAVFCGLSWFNADQSVRHVCIDSAGAEHLDMHVCKCGETIK